MGKDRFNMGHHQYEGHSFSEITKKIIGFQELFILLRYHKF